MEDYTIGQLKMSNVITVPTVCLSLFSLFIGLFVLRRGAPSTRKQWIRVGRSLGPFGLHKKAAKQDFQRNGRALVREGYQKHKDQNFVIQSAFKEQLVIAPKFLPEVRMLPESKLSHGQVLSDYWVGEHIGADIAMDGHQHIDAVRGPMTKALKHIVPVMFDVYRATSEAIFSQVPKDTKQMNVYNFCYGTVASVTSTVMVGQELAYGGDWNNIIMAYFPEAQRIRSALWPWPRALRPIVKPILVRNNKLETILKQAEKFLEPHVRRRRQPDNQDVDVLKFLADYGESERKIALQIVGIVTGALNTSTHALTVAIYDICNHPEYIDAIRAEASRALESEGGQWTMGVIKKLHFLDSFMKESLRLFAPEGLAVTRVATSSFGLSDGTWIPKGTYIAVAGEGMALDPSFYKEPEKFDGRRFLDVDGKPLSPEQQFHGIEAGNGMWGAGRLTCPGRHYASALSKLIIANLLLRYDISFPEGQKEKRPGMEDDANLLPDMAQTIVLKERNL